MSEKPNVRATSGSSWQTRQLAVMCAVCLATGLLAGYFLRGSASAPVPAPPAAAATAPASQSMGESAGQMQTQQMPYKMPTLDELKGMADTKAAPLLEKMKSDPKNPQLANQLGLIYENAHQFKEAAGYFEKSLQYDPKNVGVRADYASCLYYSGDVDGALAQLNKSLAYDPKHAGTLMNIGIIKWRGKHDVDGAVAAWEKLLQYHPDSPQRDLVQHMIAHAKQTKTAKTVGEGQKG
jgi:cytochrome c-type biogenesis protein CcmH/NrfG